MIYIATAYLGFTLLSALAGEDVRYQRFFAPPVPTLAQCQEVVSQFEGTLKFELTSRGYRLESVDASCFSMPIRKNSPQGGGHMKEAI